MPERIRLLQGKLTEDFDAINAIGLVRCGDFIRSLLHNVLNRKARLSDQSHFPLRLVGRGDAVQQAEFGPRVIRKMLRAFYPDKIQGALIMFERVIQLAPLFVNASHAPFGGPCPIGLFLRPTLITRVSFLEFPFQAESSRLVGPTKICLGQNFIGRYPL